jgi:transposase
LKPPAGNPFARANNGWWQALTLGKLEKMNLQSDLETLHFAEQQEERVEKEMRMIAAEDENIGRLLHIAGFGVITAVTVFAAIGEIGRFSEPKKLVGYAGLGARVHDSGMTTRTGKITKAGRRDLRVAMVEAAHVVANSHPHWKAELARLQPRLGYNKAIVAIARKLLITVWHVLQGKADKHAEPEAVAQKMLKFAYTIGKANRNGKTAAQFARERLDGLKMGEELTSIPWGAKKPIPLPPSKLAKKESAVPNLS